MSGHGFPNVVIRASAGTGKTFQLSNRFISLAAGEDPLDSILATTFTRKAAGEILDRILSRLAEAALDGEELKRLSHHLEAAELDAPGCRKTLHELVRMLHRLRVGTLDSFFIQVAQSFSLELGLPPGWQIVDELDDGRLRAEAVRAVLRGESTHDTLELMHLLTKGEASRSVADQIATIVADLYGFYLEAPAEAWRSLPRPPGLKPLELQGALDLLAAVELPNDKRFAKARDGDLENAQNELWDVFIGKGLAGKVLAGQTTYYGKPIEIDVIAAYEPVIAHARAVLLGRIANQNRATYKLLARFHEAYNRLKVAEHALRFDDVTRRLGDAWPDRQLDEVAYRLDAHVAHLLLDEFQDTAPAQWRVLRPFARRAADGDRQRSFFCVGDVKQAIYGWRGGVAEIFEALGEELGELKPGALNVSWRSSPVVIDTVNRVFDGLSANAALQEYPEAAKLWADRFQPHDTARRELPGHCCMVAAPRAGEGEKQEVRTAEFAAAEIERLHRRAPGRTIGILVRRNVTVARMIYLLRAAGIEASEEGGNPLVDSPAVELILSLLVLADHPGNTVARFHLANSPLAEHVGLKDHEDLAAAWRISRQVRAELMADGYGPVVYRWVEMLAPSCDGRDLNRLMQLVEMAYGYEGRATTRADDFVALVRAQRVEDPTSADVRVMTVHQAKGLQFDVVVLPELDVRLTGQTPPMVVGRPGPTAEVEHVCRYVSKNARALLPAGFQAMFAAHDRRIIEEALCVLYVQLTRPVHALHMIVAPSGERERRTPATSAGLLRAALGDGKPAEPDTILYESGDAKWFEQTEPERPPAAAEPAEPLVVKLAAASQQPTRDLDRRSPSQLEGGPRVDLADLLRPGAEAALDRGTLVHAWFEQIGWLEDGRPSDDVLQTVAERHNSAGLDVAALIGEFRRALDKPAIRAALSRSTYEQPGDESAVHLNPDISAPRWEASCEWPFAIRDGDAILRGTIDRLVVLYDGDRPVAADVIDFKTDVLSAGDPAAISARVEVYRPQLAAYRRAVAASFRLDSSSISARLAFVDPGELRDV